MTDAVGRANRANNKPVAQIDISGDVDDVFYDPLKKLIFLSCGEGVIDVLGQIDEDHYSRTAKLPTVTGARTSWWIPNAVHL